MAGQRLTDKTALEQQTGSGDLFMLVDVNDTTGSAAGTSKKIDSKYIIQTDKISISNAEVLALQTTPKTLVGALSGYMITPLNLTVIVTYVSGAETSLSSLIIGYSNASSSNYWQSMGRFYGNSTTDRTYVIPGSTAITLTESAINKPFIMWTNGAFNGTWTADAYITYSYTKIL
jgi:hypothetical protein